MGGITWANEKCPLTQTMLISMRSTAILVAITREIRERSKRFLCSLLIFPLLHRAGALVPSVRAADAVLGQAWERADAAEIAQLLLLPVAVPATSLPIPAPERPQPIDCQGPLPHICVEPDELHRWLDALGSEDAERAVLLLLLAEAAARKGHLAVGAYGVKKRPYHDFLNGRAIQRHADGPCIMAFEAITQVAKVQFVCDPQPMSAHATADQPLEQGFPVPCGSTCAGNRCLLRLCFLGILSQTCLVLQELFPTNVGRIHPLLKRHPLFHRLAYHSCPTSSWFALDGINGTPPRDKGSCVRGVVQNLDDHGFGWHFPEQLTFA